MSARKSTTSKSTTTQPKAQTSAKPQAKKVDPSTRVQDLISKAATDDDRRAAVIEAVKLAKLPDLAVNFVRTYGHLVHGAMAETTKRIADTEHQVTSLAEQLKARRAALNEAKASESRRSAEEVMFAYRVTRVHKLYNQQELARAWGVNKSYVSNIVKAGEYAAKIGTTATADVNFLKKTQKDHSPTLREAMEANGPTIESVREAITVSKTERKEQQATDQRHADEERRGEEETPGVDAHKVLARATALINQLNANAKSGNGDDTVADLGKVTGDKVVHDLLVSLKAYTTRTRGPLPVDPNAVKIHPRANGKQPVKA